jgi:hypothetical protein
MTCPEPFRVGSSPIDLPIKGLSYNGRTLRSHRKDPSSILGSSTHGDCSVVASARLSVDQVVLGSIPTSHPCSRGPKDGLSLPKRAYAGSSPAESDRHVGQWLVRLADNQDMAVRFCPCRSAARDRVPWARSGWPSNLRNQSSSRTVAVQRFDTPRTRVRFSPRRSRQFAFEPGVIVPGVGRAAFCIRSVTTPASASIVISLRRLERMILSSQLMSMASL